MPYIKTSCFCIYINGVNCKIKLNRLSKENYDSFDNLFILKEERKASFLLQNINLRV